MSRLILDVSSLVRWAGPPVGIVRVESEIAAAATAASLPLELAFFDPAKQVFRSLAPAWAEALLGWHAAIDSFGLDRVFVKHGWRRLLPSRGPIVSRLERLRLSAPNPLIAGVIQGLQRLVLSVKAHDLPFLDAEGRRISLVRADLALAGPIVPEPGDVILIVSSDWGRKDPLSFAALKRDSGVRITAVCYDLIPITHSQFYRPSDAAAFRRYWDGMFSVLDTVIVNSPAIRDDVIAHVRANGTPAPAVAIVPLGSEFPEATGPLDDPLPDGLEQDRYALFVSTIEPRKNHRMLLDIWERLLARGIPQQDRFKLVFVGRDGWMTEDVLRRLEAPAAFAGTVVHLRRVGDELLRALYANAAFCLYPSVYEGYGLPVVEAFALGKAVISSNGGALRDVAEGLCPKLDPGDTAGWEATIADWITNPSRRREAEERIKRQFRPITWSETAQRFLSAAGFDVASRSRMQDTGT
jgi:glycosyltransferase involved in cell wall biosynthesis